MMGRIDPVHEFSEFPHMNAACRSSIEAPTGSQDPVDFREGSIQIWDMMHHENRDDRIKTVGLKRNRPGIDHLEFEPAAALTEIALCLLQHS